MEAWVVFFGFLILAQSTPVELDGSPEQIDFLIEQLESDDDYDRKAAIVKLGQIGPAARKAIPALEALPGDSGDTLRARRRIGPGPEPFPHSIVQKDISSDQPGISRKQYVLHIDETSQDIPLGTTREYVGAEEDLRGAKEGLDEEALLIRWLEPNRLLHIHWTTISIGGGRFQAQGNLLLLKSDGAWSEILRDWREYYYGGGASDYQEVRLEFGWDRARKVLFIDEVSSRSGTGLSAPGPLVESYFREGDTSIYWRAYQVVRTWEATVVEGKLQFRSGVISLGVNPEPDRSPLNAPWFTVRSAAEFVAKSPDFKAGRGPAEQLNYVLQHHPNLRYDSPCPERLVVGDGVSPFVPSATEMLRTGDNTSW